MQIFIPKTRANQIQFGPNGECLLDYIRKDALEAGFEKMISDQKDVLPNDIVYANAEVYCGKKIMQMAIEQKESFVLCQRLKDSIPKTKDFLPEFTRFVCQEKNGKMIEIKKVRKIRKGNRCYLGEDENGNEVKLYSTALTAILWSGNIQGADLIYTEEETFDLLLEQDMSKIESFFYARFHQPELPISFTIPIDPITKKNHSRIGRKRSGETFILPSREFEMYQNYCECFVRPYRISKPVNVKAIFYLGTKRKADLTNLNESLHDVLVHYQCLTDDDYHVIVSTDGSRVFYDPERPRTEVMIEEDESKENKYDYPGTK